MNVKIVYFVAFFLLFMRFGVADAQSEKNEFKEIMVPLLDGRLTVKMPEGSKIEPRQFGIMSAQQASRDETRVVFEEGDKKLVLMAYETFSTVGEHFEENVKKDVEQWEEYEGVDLILKKKANKKYYIYPSIFNPNNEAILIQALLYVNYDNTVQRLVVYVNPSFYKDIEDVKKLADNILNSTNNGERKLDLSEGTKALFLYSDEYKLEIDFPEGFVHNIQEGPDFLVHRIRRVSEFGLQPDSIGIYVGGHPSFHHSHIEKSELKLKEIKRKFLDKKVKWTKYSRKDRPNEILVETIIPLSKISDYFLIHVFISSKNEKDLERLLKIIDTARISKKKSE